MRRGGSARRGGRPGSLAGPRPPSPRAPAPRTPRGHQVPPPPAAPRRPFPGAPAPAAPNNGLSHAARRGLGKGPGAARGRGAAAPARHLPPAARPSPRRRGRHLEPRLTFPEPARPRAPPSLCLWQTWFAEKRAPSLAAAAAASAPLLPSCPRLPAPSPARPTLALSSPRSPPSPPALAPRSFQLSKRQPRPRPHRPGTLPRRLGWVPLPPPLARRPAARCWLARAPARPAPPAPSSAPPAPLPPPPPPLVYSELNRTWLPGRASGAGGSGPRLMAASANRRSGAGPGRPGGTPCQRRAAAVPAAAASEEPLPRSRGRAGPSGCEPLSSVDVGRGREARWAPRAPGPGAEGLTSAPGGEDRGGRGALRQRRRGGGADPRAERAGPLPHGPSPVCPSPPPAAARASPALIAPSPRPPSPWAPTPTPTPDSHPAPRPPRPRCPLAPSLASERRARGSTLRAGRLEPAPRRAAGPLLDH